MDPEAVDLGTIVMKTIEPSLLGPPVEAVGPVGAQIAQVLRIRPVIPARLLELIGPARMAKARLQVVEHVLGHLDLVRLGHSALRRHCATARQRSRVAA